MRRGGSRGRGGAARGRGGSGAAGGKTSRPPSQAQADGAGPSQPEATTSGQHHRQQSAPGPANSRGSSSRGHPTLHGESSHSSGNLGGRRSSRGQGASSGGPGSFGGRGSSRGGGCASGRGGRGGRGAHSSSSSGRGAVRSPGSSGGRGGASTPPPPAAADPPPPPPAPLFRQADPLPTADALAMLEQSCTSLSLGTPKLIRPPKPPPKPSATASGGQGSGGSTSSAVPRPASLPSQLVFPCRLRGRAVQGSDRWPGVELCEESTKALGAADERVFGQSGAVEGILRASPTARVRVTSFQVEPENSALRTFCRTTRLRKEAADEVRGSVKKKTQEAGGEMEELPPSVFLSAGDVVVVEELTVASSPSKTEILVSSFVILRPPLTEEPSRLYGVPFVIREEWGEGDEGERELKDRRLFYATSHCHLQDDGSFRDIASTGYIPAFGPDGSEGKHVGDVLEAVVPGRVRDGATGWIAVLQLDRGLIQQPLRLFVDTFPTTAERARVAKLSPNQQTFPTAHPKLLPEALRHDSEAMNGALRLQLLYGGLLRALMLETEKESASFPSPAALLKETWTEDGKSYLVLLLSASASSRLAQGDLVSLELSSPRLSTGSCAADACGGLGRLENFLGTAESEMRESGETGADEVDGEDNICPVSHTSSTAYPSFFAVFIDVRAARSSLCAELSLAGARLSPGIPLRRHAQSSSPGQPPGPSNSGDFLPEPSGPSDSDYDFLPAKLKIIVQDPSPIGVLNIHTTAASHKFLDPSTAKLVPSRISAQLCNLVGKFVKTGKTAEAELLKGLVERAGVELDQWQMAALAQSLAPASQLTAVVGAPGTGKSLLLFLTAAAYVDLVGKEDSRLQAEAKSTAKSWDEDTAKVLVVARQNATLNHLISVAVERAKVFGEPLFGQSLRPARLASSSRIFVKHWDSGKDFPDLRRMCHHSRWDSSPAATASLAASRGMLSSLEAELADARAALCAFAEEAYQAEEGSQDYGELMSQLEEQRSLAEALEKATKRKKKALMTEILIACRINCLYVTADMASSTLLNRLGFSPTLLLVDEASMIRTTELLSLIHFQRRSLCRVSLYGDSRQLPPFTRLSSVVPAAQVLSSSVLNGATGEDPLFTPITKVVYLAKVRRAHPSVLQIFRHFYQETFYGAGQIKLESGGSEETGAELAGVLPLITLANRVLFLDVVSPSERVGKSWMNAGQVEAVLAVVGRLVERGVAAESVLLLTPYLGMKAAMESALLDAFPQLAGLWEVATSRSSVGMERDVVVLACGRGGEFKGGSLLDATLINVSLSRASSLLVVIGDREAWATSANKSTCHLSAPFAPLLASFQPGLNCLSFPQHWPSQ